MKTNARDERAATEPTPEKTTPSHKLALRTGLRAGRVWRSGNKTMSDDWLAPL